MRRLIASALVACGLLGCSMGGGVGKPHSSGTETRLDRANFRIVKARARGEDWGFRALGFLPLVSPSVGDAMDQLLVDVPSKGRAISLANLTEEYRTLYFVLFSLTRVIVRADVIEFVEESAAQLPASPSRRGVTVPVPQPPASAVPARR